MILKYAKERSSLNYKSMVWEEEHTRRMKNKPEHALRESYMTMASFSVTEQCGGNFNRNMEWVYAV